MEQNKEKNFDIAMNHKYFTTSLLKILNFLEKKSVEIIEGIKANYDIGSQVEPDYKKTNKYKAHIKFQETCQAIRNGFSNQTDNFDEGKIIKKIYKVLTQYMDKFFPEPDIFLFQLKNEKKEVVTIIPGLDINIVVKDKKTSENDMKQLWGEMYMMYISATNMINAINKKKKDEKTNDLLSKMRDKIIEMGTAQSDDLSNPFIGLNVETGEYDINKMFAGVENAENMGEMSPENMLKMTGIGNMFDMNKLSEQLQDIKDDDIDNAAKTISNLVGGGGDSDVNDVCSQLVKNVVEDLKNNKGGNLNFLDIAKSVAGKVKNNMEDKKFEKTASKFNNFMSNSQENLKNLKDENGNPIGEKLMKTFSIPLELAKAMGNQKGGQKK